MKLGLGFGVGSSTRLGLDVDAASFISRASITDAAQKAAINSLVISLKGYGIWSKFFALYPYVGGNASSHAQNLKSSSYTITWNGAVTHDANGITGDGSTGYGDTGLAQSVVGSNGGISAYSKTVPIIESNQMSIAVDNGAGESFLLNHDTFAAENQTYGLYGNGSQVARMAQPSPGFYSINRTSNNSLTLYRNGSSAATNSTGITQNTIAFNFAILARNSAGTFANYSQETSALSAIHNGLTDTESANFYIAVQTYQTSLGRNV